MASLRRGQALGLAIVIISIYLLFFSGSGTATDFRKTTEASLSQRRGVLRGPLSDADLTAQTNRELQKILDQRKEILEQNALQGEHSRLSHARVQDKEREEEEEDEEDEAEDVSVAGRKSMPKAQEKPKYPTVDDADVNLQSDDDDGIVVKDQQTAKPDDGEELAREELQIILKKSPIIIFSKSYCPYSKRAKALLLETYTITPTPYVVELDLMTESAIKSQSHLEDNDQDDEPVSQGKSSPTLGRKLQDLLASLTGRSTVPNIMINAQSLGGGDDVARMHEEGILEEEIKKLGGKRIVSVEKTRSAGGDKAYRKT